MALISFLLSLLPLCFHSKLGSTAYLCICRIHHHTVPTYYTRNERTVASLPVAAKDALENGTCLVRNPRCGMHKYTTVNFVSALPLIPLRPSLLFSSPPLSFPFYRFPSSLPISCLTTYSVSSVPPSLSLRGSLKPPSGFACETL